MSKLQQGQSILWWVFESRSVNRKGRKHSAHWIPETSPDEKQVCFTKTKKSSDTYNERVKCGHLQEHPNNRRSSKPGGARHLANINRIKEHWPTKHDKRKIEGDNQLRWLDMRKLSDYEQNDKWNLIKLLLAVRLVKWSGEIFDLIIYWRVVEHAAEEIVATVQNWAAERIKKWIKQIKQQCECRQLKIRQ